MTTGFLETPESEKSYGYVTCRIIRRVADTPDDADAFPTILPAEGTVVFIPKQKNVTASNYSALVLNETIEAPLNSEGYAVRYKGADTTLIALVVGTYDVRFNIVSGGDIPPMTVQITSNHTQETPLDLATIRPPAENEFTTVQVISVDPSVVDGSVLIKSGASVYGVPQSEFKGEAAPIPEIAWAGDVLTVDGVSSPPLTGPAGPAPATSWSGTSLIVGDNPPVDLQGPVGARGPVGSPGAVATASDFLLVGPGRPDTPATTGGVITGSEPVGCEFRSTDGAGVGAWVWMKRSTGWEVTDGDTGLRRLEDKSGGSLGALWPADGLYVIRVNRSVLLRADWGTTFPGQTNGITRAPAIYTLDAGFKSNGNPTGVLDSDGANVGDAIVWNQAFKVKGSAGVWRKAFIQWLTTDPWPTTLPGTPA